MRIRPTPHRSTVERQRWGRGSATSDKAPCVAMVDPVLPNSEDEAEVRGVGAPVHSALLSSTVAQTRCDEGYDGASVDSSGRLAHLGSAAEPVDLLDDDAMCLALDTAVYTACSELLGWGLGDTHATGPLGIERSGGEVPPVGALSGCVGHKALQALMPAYPLRTPFFDEERDGSVRWLGDEAERDSYVLHVMDGKLADADGHILGATGPAQMIFVLETTSGTIFVHTVALQHAGVLMPVFCHSSFVAGKPVAAAGEMLIDRGILKALSNASGHYQPPPSCLQVAMTVLARMGLEGLQHVELELVCPVAGTALSLPPTGEHKAYPPPRPSSPSPKHVLAPQPTKELSGLP